MKRKARRYSIDGYSLLLTIIAVAILIYVLAPLVIVVINSFNSVAYSVFPPQGFSLRWYEHLLERPEFAKGLRNSLLVGFASTLLAIIAATLAAIALVRYRFPGANLLKTFFLSPIVVPQIVLGLSFYIVFLRWGIFGSIQSLVLAHVIITLPFALAVLTSTVASIDARPEEAARDLGAREWQVILYVMLPQMKVGILVSALFAFIISFDQIDTTLFLVRPATNTLPVEMFLYMERWQDPSMASLSTLLILFAIVLLFVVKRVIGRTTDLFSRR